MEMRSRGARGEDEAGGPRSGRALDLTNRVATVESKSLREVWLNIGSQDLLSLPTVYSTCAMPPSQPHNLIQYAVALRL